MKILKTEVDIVERVSVEKTGAAIGMIVGGLVGVAILFGWVDAVDAPAITDNLTDLLLAFATTLGSGLWFRRRHQEG